MIKFLISLFRKTEEKEPEPQIKEFDREFDFIDYDGMGNQGRFPVSKNNKRKQR